MLVSSDTKATIGTIIGTALVVCGLLVTLVSCINTRIDDLRIAVQNDLRSMDARMGRMDARIGRMEVRMDGFETRLDAVEVALAKMNQRLATIERVVLPLAQGD